MSGIRAFWRWVVARWRWLVLGFVLSPFLFWGLVWLGLASPWGKAFVSSKVEGRYGVKTVIGSLGFVPFGEIWLSDVEVAPGGKIRAVEVDLNWWALAAGEVVVDQVTVTDPIFDLSLNELKDLMPIPPIPDTSRQDSAEASSGRSGAEPNEGTPGANSKPKQPEKIPGQQTIPENKKPDSRSRTAEPKLPKLAPPSQWLKVSGGSLRIRSSRVSEPFLEVNGVSLELPLDGSSGEGFFRAAQIQLMGQDLTENFEQRIANSKELWIANFDTVEDSMNPSLSAKLRVEVRKSSGLPFGLICAAANSLPIEFQGARVEGETKILGRFTGILKSPGTWFGQASLSGSKIALLAGDSPMAYFDQASASAILAGGRIATGICRADGDQGAVIGFGELSSEGGGGMLRFVVAPSYRDQLDRSLNRVRPGWSSAELDTADRYFVDLALFANQGVFVMKLDDGSIISLPEAKDLIISGSKDPDRFSGGK